MVKYLPTVQETWVQFPPGMGRFLEKEMAIHSSILAWKILWMEACGRLQSMGSQKARHDRTTALSPLVYTKFQSIFAVPSSFL